MILNFFLFLESGGADGSGKYVTPARRPQQQISNNRNSTPPQHHRQQQPSPASMSRTADSDRTRPSPGGRGMGSSGNQGPPIHSGRDQYSHHDDYTRGGGGAGRGRGGGGAFAKESTPSGRGSGGHRMEKSRSETTSEFKHFRDNFHLTDQRYNQEGKQTSPKLSSPPTAGGVGNRNSPHDRNKGASPPNEAAKRTSPPTASIIAARQDSVEQRMPTPAKTPPTVAVVAQQQPPMQQAPPPGAGATPSAQAAGPPSSINVAKSKLNPNAKEFVLNPKAKDFVPSRPSVGQTPPPPRPITPATPTGNIMYYPQGPGILPQAYFAGGVTMPNVSVANSYIYAPPTSQPPPGAQFQHRFRGGAHPIVSSAGGPRDANNQVLNATGQPLLSPQAFIPPNAAAAAAVAAMPHHMQHAPQQQGGHQHQQQIIPVSGGPPHMVMRPLGSDGATSLPGWSLQPNPGAPHPQMGGPPPPAGTPTSVNQPPLPPTPPTSGVVQANPHQGGHPPPQMAPNGNVGGQPTPGMYNFIPGGSMQPQSLPHQFPAAAAYPHGLLLPGGQTSLIQQPMIPQGQPVTSIAGGYPFPHSHPSKFLSFCQFHSVDTAQFH